MSSAENNAPTLILHQEVRFRIAARELAENARRIFELCLELGIAPESVSADWKKENIGITQEVIDNAVSLRPSEYDGNTVFFMSDPLSEAVVLRNGNVVEGWGHKNLLRELLPTAEQLEYHVEKHVLLLKKYNEIAENKKESPEEWKSGGLFHHCPNCDQVFGSTGVNERGMVICSVCGNKGSF
jgi:hypothetical protein